MATQKSLPKIVFTNSWLYDAYLKREKKYERPDDRVIWKRVRAIEKKWKQHEKKILTEISCITKLPWHQKEIVCYVSYHVRPYSNPLTVNLKSNIDTVTHELIHRILSEPENRKKMWKNWMAIMRRYPKESQITKIHIVIHAIHAHILLKIFGKKRLEEEKEDTFSLKDYRRAWEIVDSEGYKNIIALLTKGFS